MLEIIFFILVLAVVLWGGDRLLALLPGNEKLKQIVRIIVIVVVALWALSIVASFFGIAMPWGTGPIRLHRYR